MTWHAHDHDPLAILRPSPQQQRALEQLAHGAPLERIGYAEFRIGGEPLHWRTARALIRHGLVAPPADLLNTRGEAGRITARGLREVGHGR